MFLRSEKSFVVPPTFDERETTRFAGRVSQCVHHVLKTQKKGIISVKIGLHKIYTYIIGTVLNRSYLHGRGLGDLSPHPSNSMPNTVTDS